MLHELLPFLTALDDIAHCTCGNAEKHYTDRLWSKHVIYKMLRTPQAMN